MKGVVLLFSFKTLLTLTGLSNISYQAFKGHFPCKQETDHITHNVIMVIIITCKFMSLICASSRGG